MKNLVFVGIAKRRRHAVEYGGHHVKRDAVPQLCEQLAQRESVHVFHDEIGEIVVYLEVVDGDDMGACQKRRRSGLVKAGESRLRQVVHIVKHHALPRGQGRKVYLLHRHPALHAGIPGELDACKAARARFLKHAIAPQYRCLACLVRFHRRCWREHGRVGLPFVKTLSLG